MGTARPTARRVRGPRASRLIVLDDRSRVRLLQIEETSVSDPDHPGLPVF